MSENNVDNIYASATEKLSNGFLKSYQPPLEEIHIQLKELKLKQNSLILQIHDENLSLAELQYSTELQDIFKRMALYHNKLINIKKDMKQLHERSTRLKKRALKLQQVQEKQQQDKLQRIKKEEELIEQKPSTSQNSK